MFIVIGVQFLFKNIKKSLEFINDFI